MADSDNSSYLVRYNLVSNSPEFFVGADWYPMDTSSGGGTIVDGETPSGTINSSNVTFTLAHTPSPATSLHLYYNGQRLTLTGDYTLATGTITMVVAPATGSVLLADYRY